LKTENTYTLWTFQTLRSIEELKNTGIIEARWDRYVPTDPFIKVYKWMVQQMTQRNIFCHGCAPIWAWHSCGKYEQAPKLIDARYLLCDLALEAGIQTIEFECLVELALLSDYGTWNQVLGTIGSFKDEVKFNKETENRLFKISRKKMKEYDSIQATLPYLKLAWVKEIRDLKLKPNDFSYNPDEVV